MILQMIEMYSKVFELDGQGWYFYSTQFIHLRYTKSQFLDVSGFSIYSSTLSNDSPVLY
jgi:hypothetical protein